MRRYPLYVFDLDGTLYRGSEALPGAAETVAGLRQGGAIVRFLTNNSSQTPAAQAAKLTAMGIAADPGEVLNSGLGAAKYLASEGLGRAFVVGEPGLREVLASSGIHCASPEEQCDVVLAGICRSFTYELMNEAMQRIRNGAKFVATNPDATYPMEGSRLVPGAGAVVAAIQTCSGVEPFVVGKPNTYLLDLILAETSITPSDVLVVGDRYETDIVSGQRAGCDTVLVLTGVTQSPPPGVRSIESLDQLLQD